MRLTTNLGLKKPEGTDVVNIDDFNYNADILDAKVKEISNKLSSISTNAKNTSFDNSSNGMAASNVQDAIEENKTSILDLNNDLDILKLDMEENVSNLQKINFVHSIGIDKNSIYLKYNAKPSQQFNVNDIIENYNSNYFYMFVKPSDGNPIYLLDMCVRNPTVSERGYYIFEIKKDNGKYKIYDNTSIGSLINFKINSITSPSETFTLGSSSYIKVLEILLVPAYVGKAYLASKTTSALSLMEQQISELEIQLLESEV